MTDEPIKDYHSRPEISRSDLFQLTKTPKYFKWYIDNKNKSNKKTPALIFGSAFHKAVLEPDGFGSEFAVLPQCDRRTKEGKAIYSEFESYSKDKQIISADDFNTITGMMNSVFEEKYAVALLKNAEIEKSHYFIDDFTGVKCKCRPDAISTIGEKSLIIDLKSTQHSDTDTFMRESVKYGYDLQAYMYTYGLEKITGKHHDFVFIAVEKEEPYMINILQADEYMLKRGEMLFRELIGIYADCLKTGNWYGNLGKFNQINNLSIPAYLKSEIE